MTEKEKADLDTLVLQTTHALRYKEIQKILEYAFHTGIIIEHEQLCKLTDLFDPTQESCEVGKL